MRIRLTALVAVALLMILAPARARPPPGDRRPPTSGPAVDALGTFTVGPQPRDDVLTRPSATGGTH